MAHLPDLNTRYQNILKATVKHYIATAEPVGSKTLAEEYDLNVSSATIRNAMGRLESAGLLYQPHVSAGRIPSDFGYRIYVDRLLVRDENISKIIARFLEQELQSEKGNFEALLQRATKILAALSGYIALITFPQKLNTTIHHLQLVRVASGQIMLIVVTDSYHTQSILIESPFSEEAIEEEVIRSDLQILSNFLNHKLKGRSLDKIAAIDWGEIDREFQSYTDFLKKLAEAIQRSLKPSTFNPIAIHGVAEILRQPEFSRLEQVQTLLYLLEEKQEQLLPVIYTFPDLDRQTERVTIKIGAENPLEPMQICTLVSANYYQDRLPVGSVGVLGPTRMLYENAIALVETTADYLSDTLK
ncbi:heat-inducible transcriptional repressor HrcA [Myxosarcina sp. GI1(2024)]